MTELKDISLDELAKRWIALKDEEIKLYNNRMLIEKEIELRLNIKDEESRTISLSSYTLQVVSKLNKSIDDKEWNAIKDEIPAHLSPLVYKARISQSRLDNLVLHDPALYRKVYKALKFKKSKTYITIKQG